MSRTERKNVLDRSESSTGRRDRLFGLLHTMMDAEAVPARVCDVDRFVDGRRAGMFLKHDVHGLDLNSLIDFARAERDAALVGSYFFMAPNHPLTTPHYGPKSQFAAMREIQDLGHEVGVHVDPWFLLHQHSGQSLRAIMEQLFAAFRAAGIAVRSGNTHGNSRFKMRDVHGFGTSFDLFVELARQVDYPDLQDVPQTTAESIRRERCSLRDFGIVYWADLPLWSACHGFVVTSFVSDNWLGKRGTYELFVHPDTIGQYKLADRQPPGSRTMTDAREYVPIDNVAATAPPAIGQRYISFDSNELDRSLAQIVRHPVLMLIHPEFYCDR